MEVPANLRTALIGIRYWLVALLFLAASTLLVSCGGGETKTTIVIAEDIGTIILTIDDDSLVAGGNTTRVVGEVSKYNDEPVPDGTTVNFTVTPIGDIPATTITQNGVATVILTSDTTAGKYSITATAGDVAQVAFGEFIPGAADTANTTLSANPNSIEADGVSTSLITLVAQDTYGNPVADGSEVNFYLASNGGTGDPGTLSSATAPTTKNGIATVELTSSENDDSITTVTAVVGPVTKTTLVGLGTIVGDGTGSGTATNIVLDITMNTIRVKNSGGDETTVIKATAIDETGSPVTDCDPASNIRFEIINGPGGGERLDGNGLLVEKSTVNGMATVTLSSGTVSGTVNVQVSVILNGDCTDTDIPTEGYYSTAITTPIGIEAGEPANIIIFEDPLLDDPNDDGSLSRTYSALAQDLHGNPVENGIVIYFGLVDNPDPSGPPYLGYKAAGSNGRTYGDDTFTGTGFNSLKDDDVLIILEGKDEGGHRIKSVDNSTKLTLYNILNGSETGLDYVAGSAELGTVCGSVQTGNYELDTLCNPVPTTQQVKGVAHTKLTWPPQAIGKPFHLYAESVGGDVGDTFANSYYAVAPIKVIVNIVPNSVSGVNGAQNLYVQAEVEDGAGHDIQGQVVTFVTGDESKAKFGNSTSDTDITDINGFASVSTLDIIPYDEGLVEPGDETGCKAGDTVTIIASLGGSTGEATVSCK